jgi:hypothetical protein
MDARIAFGLGISAFFAFLRYLVPVMPKWISGLGILAGLGLIAYAIMSWLIPTESPLAKDSFPGFSSTFALKINDAASAKRQYIFDYKTNEGAESSFYFSSSGDRFIYAIKDVHGDVQSLDLKIGDGGVPISKFVFLTCEAGLATNETYLRVLINEKEVMSRILPFRFDLGSRQWVKGEIGADVTGNNNSAFEYLSFDGFGHVTMPDRMIGAMLGRFKTYLRDSNSPIAKDL